MDPPYRPLAPVYSIWTLIAKVPSVMSEIKHTVIQPLLTGVLMEYIQVQVSVRTYIFTLPAPECGLVVTIVISDPKDPYTAILPPLYTG